MQAQAATPCFARKEAFGHPPRVTSVDVRMDGWMELVTVYGAPEMAQETPTSTNGINAWRPKLSPRMDGSCHMS